VSIDALIRRFEEPLRFLVVGLINTAINYGAFMLLLWTVAPGVALLSVYHLLALRLLGTHSYAVVQWIAWALCVPISTYMMRRFVFKRSGNFGFQVLRAYGVYLPAQLIASGVLIFCVDVLRFPAPVGQLIALCFSTIISYLGHKLFTFRKPRAAS
jgi:putative flippase GtrA